MYLKRIFVNKIFENHNNFDIWIHESQHQLNYSLQLETVDLLRTETGFRCKEETLEIMQETLRVK